jgi:hypothetical protein
VNRLAERLDTLVRSSSLACEQQMALISDHYPSVRPERYIFHATLRRAFFVEHEATRGVRWI